MSAHSTPREPTAPVAYLVVPIVALTTLTNVPHRLATVDLPTVNQKRVGSTKKEGIQNYDSWDYVPPYGKLPRICSQHVKRVD